jgi:hypothetical protein
MPCVSDTIRCMGHFLFNSYLSQMEDYLPAFIDLSGDRFSRLTVLRREGTNKHGNSMWLCRCECGNTLTVASGHLRSAHTQSCGCLMVERAREANTTHGLHHTYFRKTFAGAKGRCTNPNDHKYPDYGARGIRFLFTDIAELAAELGPRPTPQHSIDRIDNDGHYESGNVRWATRSEQMKNRRAYHLWRKRAA